DARLRVEVHAVAEQRGARDGERRGDHEILAHTAASAINSSPASSISGAGVAVPGSEPSSPPPHPTGRLSGTGRVSHVCTGVPARVTSTATRLVSGVTR